jgi:hypothetical protein
MFGNTCKADGAAALRPSLVRLAAQAALLEFLSVFDPYAHGQEMPGVAYVQEMTPLKWRALVFTATPCLPRAAKPPRPVHVSPELPRHRPTVPQKNRGVDEPPAPLLSRTCRYLQPEQEAQQSAEAQHASAAFARPATPSAITAINNATFNVFIVSPLEVKGL